MRKFNIEIQPSGRIGNQIRLQIESINQEDADDFAQVLANEMPLRTYYCQKNSRDIECK